MKEFSIKYNENNKLFSFTKNFSEEDLYVIYESRGKLYRSKASKKWLQSVLKGAEVTAENALEVYKSNPNIQRVEVVVGKKASDEVISKFRNSKMTGNKSEEEPFSVKLVIINHDKNIQEKPDEIFEYPKSLKEAKEFKEKIKKNLMPYQEVKIVTQKGPGDDWEDYNDSPTVTNKPKPKPRGPKPLKVVLVKYRDGGKGYRVYPNIPEAKYNGTDVVKFRGDREGVAEFLKNMKKLHPNYSQNY